MLCWPEQERGVRLRPLPIRKPDLVISALVLALR
jgi:hypothetical protein